MFDFWSCWIMNDDERKKKRKLGTLIRVVRRFISRSRKGTCICYFFANHPNCLAQEFRENVLNFVIYNYFMPEQSIDQNIFPEMQEQLSGFYPPPPKVNDRGHKNIDCTDQCAVPWTSEKNILVYWLIMH